MGPSFTSRDLIEAMSSSIPTHNAEAAIRATARNAIERFRAVFGDPTMPLDLYELASFLGIGLSRDLPTHSRDAELVPVGDGRVAIRVNPDRAETRKRFSIGHEISHTFFPSYEQKAWCRTDSRYRTRHNPDDMLEMLCDVGASELLLPDPWFHADAATVSTGTALVALADKYVASREATARRLAETHEGLVAAIFLSWKLKPTQQSTIGNLNQQDLFVADPLENARHAKKLRLDYAVPSAKFAATGYYLPADKSVENAGPLYEAASAGISCEGECKLDLGTAAGLYRVLAVPVWTSDENLGPRGENSVCAIIEPLDVPLARTCDAQSSCTLFAS